MKERGTCMIPLDKESVMHDTIAVNALHPYLESIVFVAGVSAKFSVAKY